MLINSSLQWWSWDKGKNNFSLIRKTNNTFTADNTNSGNAIIDRIIADAAVEVAKITGQQNEGYTFSAAARWEWAGTEWDKWRNEWRLSFGVERTYCYPNDRQIIINFTVDCERLIEGIK